MTNSNPATTASFRSETERLTQSLTLDPQFTRTLPGDKSGDKQPRQTTNVCWSRCDTTPVTAPVLIAYFEGVANELGLSNAIMNSSATTHWLSGNLLLPGSQPYSTCYGGHQFGQWAGQLGDGRAITLAETIYQNKRWEVQLKGAGLTPYSRTADGRAVMRSSLREFLCSEAVHHLGIPTTRALSLVSTGDKVVRDMFYDGNPDAEAGAIVCRVAPSFIRFGNFELLAARQETDLLNQLIDLTIRRDFSELSTTESDLSKTENGKSNKPSSTSVRAAWFAEVCRRTATMIVEWQRVGFVHGVMNTDNMSIMGLTIDYGPYGWLDNYDPNWTPNTTDAQGRRYRFANQAHIARWNLVCLANALAYVIEDHDVLKDGIDTYDQTLSVGLGKMQLNKFGLINSAQSTNQFAIDKHNQEMIETAYELMHKSNVDFTLFFTGLENLAESAITPDHFAPAFYQSLSQSQSNQWSHWLKRYWEQIKQQQERNPLRKQQMSEANPKFILRNYLCQQAIDAAEQADFSLIKKLMHRLQTPYHTITGDYAFEQQRPAWAMNKPGCSMLSCSS